MRKDISEFDVIVWGATGFTGRLVAEYLYERYGASGELRWAMGGRNESKLSAVRDEIGADGVPLLVGDAGDPASLDALAAQTRVVCTTVGPYAKYGSELVAACARQGTHYCDLAGEAQWIRRMIDAHEETAARSGARIVHCCGFDSIPSDLGVLFLQDLARDRLATTCPRVSLRVRKMRGTASGGTVASLLNAIEEGRADRETRRVLADPYSLYPRGEDRGKDRTDQPGPAYDDAVDSWTAPFVMAAINAKVVRRSNAVAGFPYGRQFRYDEAVMTGRGVTGFGSATAMTAALAGFVLLATPAPTRALLNRLFLPQPGEGPDKDKREKGYFDMLLTGHADDGSTIQARVRGDRDPGYGSTSRMLGESAVCLALDDDTPNIGGGFWTPATAMGQALIRRLGERAGVTFDEIG